MDRCSARPRQVRRSSGHKSSHLLASDSGSTKFYQPPRHQNWLPPRPQIAFLPWTWAALVLDIDKLVALSHLERYYILNDSGTGSISATISGQLVYTMPFRRPAGNKQIGAPGRRVNASFVQSVVGADTLGVMSYRLTFSSVGALQSYFLLRN